MTEEERIATQERLYAEWSLALLRMTGRERERKAVSDNLLRRTANDTFAVDLTVPSQ